MLKAGVSLGAVGAALLATAAHAQVAAPEANNRDAQLPKAAEPDPAASQPAPVSGAVPTTAATQVESAPSTSAGGLGEIVVTAQRRSENLQKVPISVTAVTSEKLASAGVITLNQIQTVAPGVIVSQTFAGANAFVRGIGNVNSGFTGESPVALYIDGIYIPNAAASTFGFNNIERIEVLKGPQGTLFGRNAVGGLINVVTRDPSLKTSVQGSVGYGNYNTFDANLYATTGLASNLAMDAALLYHNQLDGWGRNVVTGREVYKNKDFSAASKIRWTPTGLTTITLRGLYDKQSGTIGIGTAVYPGTVGSDGTTYAGKYNITSRREPFNYSSEKNFGLKIEQDVGFATLISLSGYTHLHSNFDSNSPGVVGTLVQGRGAVDLNNNGASNTFTQELQLQSGSGSALKYIAGLFYMHDHFHVRSEVTPTCIGLACNPAPTPIASIGDQTLQSYAAFGEVTLTLAETTRITAGIRYTKDDKDNSAAYREPIPGFSTSVATLPAPNRFGDDGAISPKARFSKVTYRGVLAHDFTPSVMGYASFNRGFKAGAFNVTVFNNPVANPEVLDAYEVGLKTQLFERMLRFNVAAFHYNYSNIQLRTFAPPAQAGQAIVFNAAQAHIKGLDADAVLAPSPYITLNASVALLDSKFVKFPGGTCTTPRLITAAVLGGVASAPCNLAGYTLPRAPHFSGSIGGTIRVPSSVGEFIFNASNTHNSGFFWESDDRLRQNAFDQVNLSLAWKSSNGALNAQLYVHNLNKPYYFLRATEAGAGTDSFTPGEPRTYGVKLGFKY